MIRLIRDIIAAVRFIATFASCADCGGRNMLTDVAGDGHGLPRMICTSCNARRSLRQMRQRDHLIEELQSPHYITRDAA